MGKVITIADILHYAADHKLEHDLDVLDVCDGPTEKYSCCAIEAAVEDLLGWEALYYGGIYTDILKGLTAMGLDTSSLSAFGQWRYNGHDVQQARYGWLKFAALIAEEQGV
jgi:hypothetical protein